MNEELEQLLKNLRLRRILEIYDEQLRAAEKEEVSYSEFLTAPGAGAVACPAGKRPGVAHPAGQSARALVAGDVPLRPPARRQPQADPRVRRTGVHRQGREHRVHRQHRRGQDRTRLWDPAEGAGERLPLPVRPRPGPVRRDVCLAGRPLDAPAPQTPRPPRRTC